MTHWAHIQLFPESLIRLNKEIQHHPKLQLLLANHPANEFEIRLAETATYCGVVLEGTYSGLDQEKLAEILERRLYNMRGKGGILIVSELPKAVQ